LPENLDFVLRYPYQVCSRREVCNSLSILTITWLSKKVSCQRNPSSLLKLKGFIYQNSTSIMAWIGMVIPPFSVT
jgi:hypothetical protein